MLPIERERLRAWAARRRLLTSVAGAQPSDWIVADVDSLLDALDALLPQLERYDDAEHGMVLNALD
jgi:hypothetical protein